MIGFGKRSHGADRVEAESLLDGVGESKYTGSIMGGNFMENNKLSLHAI